MVWRGEGGRGECGHVDKKVTQHNALMYTKCGMEHKLAVKG